MHFLIEDIFTVILKKDYSNTSKINEMVRKISPIRGPY